MMRWRLIRWALLGWFVGNTLLIATLIWLDNAMDYVPSIGLAVIMASAASLIGMALSLAVVGGRKGI